MAAAALIFFAFYGFDAISTAAEEAKKPERDLTIAIVGSMLICTLIYMLVAAASLGASPFRVFSGSEEPLAFILRELGQPFAATLIAGAAIIALPTVIMVFMYGQSRIFFAMSRDGLLPRGLMKVGARGVPVRVTVGRKHRRLAVTHVPVSGQSATWVGTVQPRNCSGGAQLLSTGPSGQTP